MEWMVFVRVWFDNRYDCISAEYSGIRHTTKERAAEEMEKAKDKVCNNEYVEMYVRVVGKPKSNW